MSSSMERQRRYLSTPHGAAKKAEYQSSDAGKRAAARAVKSWRQRNPEKARAHNAVNRAIKSGRLIRAACEVCGDEKAHAHHDDYADHLNVRWLCATHHRQHHKENA